MTLRVVEYLQARGYEVALASYMPYRLAPNLSVPFWRLLISSPGSRVSTAFNGIPSYEIGAYLPELEFVRCFPTSIWKDLTSRFDFHIAVSGSVHAALPFLLQKKPCLAWVATPYLPDKMDRVKGYPWYRRIVDSLLDTPVCRYLEREGLKESRILALSSYTASALQEIAPGIHVSRMPIPIDIDKFSPSPGDVVIGRIGFSGRLSDRRKNIRLLIDAIYICRARGFNVTARLAGTGAEAALYDHIAQRNLTECIDFLGFVDNSAMSDFYRALDVFVIPSFQEGLGIVGPEAMACGCPVVSTRCGGAEDYVRDGANGFLVGFSAEEMADAICKIVGDRVLRKRMSVAAVDTVKNEYSQESVKQIFWDAFEQTFGVERESN